MNPMLPFWLGLALAGFVVGLFVRPMVVLRVAISLFLLAGLGLTCANLLDAPNAAWWFGASMVAMIVVFGVAIVGAAAGRLVRRLVRADEPPKRRREYNSILQD